MYYVLSSNVGLIATVLSGLLLRNRLSPETFGALFLAGAFGSILSQLNTPLSNVFDVQVPLMRGQRSSEAEIQRVISEGYRVQAWALVVEVAVLSLIAWMYATSELMTLAFAIVAASFAFGESARLDRLLLKVEGEHAALLRGSVVSSAVGAAAMVLGGLYFGGVGYLCGYGLSLVVSGMVMHLLVERRLHPQRSLIGGIGTVGPLIMGAGLAVAGFKLLEQASFGFDRVLIGHWHTLELLGIYSLAVSLATLLRAVPRSAAGALLPVYLARINHGGVSGQHSRTLAYHDLVVWCATFLVVVAIVGAELILPELFPRYGPAIWPAQLLFLANVVIHARSAPLAYLMGKGQYRFLVSTGIIGFGITVAATTLLIARFGIHGAGYAAILSATATFVAMATSLPTTIRQRIAMTTVRATALAGSCLLEPALFGTIGPWFYVCATAAILICVFKLYGILATRDGTNALNTPPVPLESTQELL